MKKNAKFKDIVDCKHCGLHDICLPVSLSSADLDLFDNIIKRKTIFEKNKIIYNYGDNFKSIYAIKSGSIKTIKTDAKNTQIIGFYLPGELLGLDAISSNRHSCSAIAIETTALCEIPFAALDEMVIKIPGLGRQLIKIMSREKESDEIRMTILSHNSAKTRLARFLINLSNRFSNRSLSKKSFKISMSRIDTANYLGLALETVSRIFSTFKQDKIINIDNKIITILNGKQLYKIGQITQQ
ncbi:MAG: transcriptional regulator FNR [Gammaproteobacteria bacterium]|nr:MAG: transcriptional regulator FNR [Gammaproteobacteria bacterium]